MPPTVKTGRRGGRERQIERRFGEGGQERRARAVPRHKQRRQTFCFAATNTDSRRRRRQNYPKEAAERGRSGATTTVRWRRCSAPLSRAVGGQRPGPGAQKDRDGSGKSAKKTEEVGRRTPGARTRESGRQQTPTGARTFRPAIDDDSRSVCWVRGPSPGLAEPKREQTTTPANGRTTGIRNSTFEKREQPCLRNGQRDTPIALAPRRHPVRPIPALLAVRSLGNVT
ncbi:hypothetical protein DFJ74DRAFT_217625 [Hyaloraphidium curvatum]|nr:hypothetical protein DFJ74DRAFT_217625 [Hyaloraphidium curvatum]